MPTEHDSDDTPKGNMSIPVSVWLDGIRAFPTIGILTGQSFETPTSIIARLKPVLNKWQAEHGRLSLDFDENKIKVQRDDGINISLSSNNVLVGWRYLTETRDKGGSHLPELLMKTKVRPYQSLLEDVQVALREVLVELYKDGSRKIHRVGIVAEGGLDRDSLPPGIETYISFLGSIWGRSSVDLNGYITAILDEGDGFSDRCHHYMEKVSSDDDAITIKLDWQRVMDIPKSPSVGRLMDQVQECAFVASNYFDKFGLGDMNYERSSR